MLNPLTSKFSPAVPETASLSDEESSGVSASYTMGGMTIAAVFNSTESVAGSSGTDKEFKEVSVAFAF